MELRAGYKNTEIGVIPNGWEVKKLGEVVEIRKGQLITDSTRVNGNIPVIAGGKTPAYYHNKANRNGKTITVSGSGASAGYVSFHDYPIFASDCSTIEESKDYSIEFMFYLLQLLQEKIYKMQTGGAQPHIHPSDLNPILIPFPKPEEQTAIATALSDTDALISSLEKLIAKKRNIKQGAMQKLLKPKEGWEVKMLGEILGKVTTGKLDANAMNENGEYRFYTCAKDYYLIDEYAFDTEALLVSGNGANVGYIHYYKGKFNAYQRTYVLTDFSVDVFYIKLYLDSYLKDRITTEVSAGNTPYIKMDTITEMIIHYPSNSEEQNQIATILSDMDNEISSLEKKLSKSKMLKQGMMQELLTGKIRLI